MKYVFICCGALGDEMSMCRNLIIDLYYQNKISVTNTIIYCIKDRNFLYSNIFENIVNHEDYNLEQLIPYCELKFNDECILIRWNNILIWPGDMWTKYGSYYNILDKNFEVTNPNLFNYTKINYYNKFFEEKFTNLVLNINYLNCLPKFQNENFIVYHYRKKQDNLWDNTIDELQTLISYFSNYNIVIFTGDINNFQEIDNSTKYKNNLYFTTNLQEYATFINSKNCEAIISVWSGGGQLASYCSNHSKIIMFFDECQLQYNDANNNNLDCWKKSENAFDFAHFTKSDRYFLGSNNCEEIKKILNNEVND